MKNLKRFNENLDSSVFKNKYLEFNSKIGKYDLYLDGDTGWGITFPNGYMEVEEGPHKDVGFMNGKIRGIEVVARGQGVPNIPDEYWTGNMSDNKLLKFFDDAISRYDDITERPFKRYE